MLDFLKVIEGFYLLESKKIHTYMQGLNDQVFWESNKFYYETIQKFIGGELNVLEFAQELSDRLLANKINVIVFLS